MDEDGLIQLLEGATERPNLEFKGRMEWNHNTIAKDILAMANTRNGGFVVFGVEDESKEPVGLSTEQLNTFDEETIQDQLERYADPHVQLNVFKITTADQKHFVVMSIQEFTETLVICRKDSTDTNEGEIYIRPTRGRPQSRRVRNSSEMRDLVERSVFKARAKFVSYGALVTEQGIQETLDEELGDLK